jgi:uncharacterized protein (TIGR02466 family)
MTEKNITGLFPIPIGKFNIERNLSLDEIKLINNQSKIFHGENFVKQSKTDKILDEDVLCDLKNFLDKSLNIFFQEIFKPSTNVCLKITQSWINYSSIGRQHNMHSHPNSIISGVFYVSTNKDSDRIIFCKNKPSQYVIHTNENNVWNSDEWWLPSEEGVLLLFPSSLYHKVPPVVGEKERISISFNSFFSGEIGNASVFTQLII